MRAKSFWLIILFLGLCANGLYSQELSAAQKKMRSVVMTFLQEEGFTPQIDSDGDVKFKKEGDAHWVLIYDNDSPYVVTIQRAGFTIGGDDGYDYFKSLVAVNRVVSNILAVSMYCTDKAVINQVRLLLSDPADFRNVFYKAVSCLSSSDSRFKKEYSALDQ